MNRTRITAVERDRIVALLKTQPIAEVRRRTGRAYGTLARIAESLERARARGWNPDAWRAVA